MRPRVPWYRRSWFVVAFIVIVALGGLFSWKFYHDQQVDQTLQQLIDDLTAREPHWQYENWSKSYPTLTDTENLAEVVFQWKSKLGPAPTSDVSGISFEWTPFRLVDMNLLEGWKLQLQEAAMLPREMEDVLKLRTGHFPTANVGFDTFRILRHSLSQQSKVMDAANLITYQSEVWLDAKQSEKVIQACHVLLKLTHAFDHEPSAALSYAFSLQTQASRLVERTLGMTEPKADQLAALQGALLASSQRRYLPQMIRGERAIVDRFLREVQDRRYSERELGFRLGTGMVKRGLSDWLDTLLDRLRERGRSSRIGSIPEERTRQLTFFQTLLDRVERNPPPWREFEPMFIPLVQNLSTVVNTTRFTGFYESELQAKALLHMAAALIAAERYRQNTGKVPTQWSDLVPGYLPAVPSDPFDEQPLRWKATDTGFVLYSVARNLKDDGGNVKEGDLRLEYFSPAHRRQRALAINWPRSVPRPLDDKEAFFAAARAGDVAKLGLLLERGVDVNTTTEYGATALCYAAENGHLEAMKLLIDRKIDLHKKDTFYSADALTWALMKEKDDAVELLLKAGAKGEASVLSAGIAKNKPKLVAAVLATGRIKQETLDSSLSKLDEKKAEISKLLVAAGAKAQPTDKTEKKTETAKSTPTKTDDSPTPTALAAEPTEKPKEAHPWTGFRGYHNAGVADGQFPPTNWDATTGKNLAWKTPIPGLGLSCPVVWGDKVFLTTAINMESPKPSLRIGQYGDVDSVKETGTHVWKLYCLDLPTGKVNWERTAYTGVPRTKRHMKSSHANATVATEGNVVVVNFGSEGLFCFDMKGNQVWKRDLGKLGSAWFFNPDYEWGFGSSPVIYNDIVIIQCDIGKQSYIAAHNLMTGDQVWTTPREEIPSWCSPTLVPLSNGKSELVTVASKFARGYDPETGKERWRLGKFSEIAVPTPFYANGMVYLTTGYAPVQPIYAIKPGGTGDLTLPKDKDSSEHVVWSKTRGGPYLPTPLVYGEHLYVCLNHGVFSCYEAKTGKGVYQKRLGGKNGYTASLVAADGRIYCTDEEGVVRVVQAGPEFKLLAVNKLGEECLSHPAISHGKIIFRCRDHVMAFEVKP